MFKNIHANQCTRRKFLITSTNAVAALCSIPLFHIGKSHAQSRGRVVMLGFDGMEPSVADEMLERGELPVLAKLRELGGAHRLESTIPPQSPVAWNSFATCQNPGQHNIFDFIRRTPDGPAGPMPLVGTGKLDPPVLSADGAQTTPAQAVSYRKGLPFWSAADAQGIRSKVLNIPFCYPPDPLNHGVMMCALGVPDLRGTTSTYFALSDAFTTEKLREEVGGGKRMLLKFSGSDETQVMIPGPRDLRYRFSDPKAYTETALHISVNRKDGKGRAEADGKHVLLEKGVWSDWLEVPFRMSNSVNVLGITRFFPQEIGQQVRIYMACVQYHPDQPYTSLSHPVRYSADLRERYGLYKTIGWAYDTHALRQLDLEEEAFLQDIDYTMSFREQLTLDELKRNDCDMLLSAWTATDRVGHMFWRFRDEKHPYYTPEAPETWKKALEHTYQRADAIVGKVMAQLRDEDTLLVFSDHGFGSWRTGFNLNTWLRDNGYLAVNDVQRAQSGFLQGIDWAKTRAYSVGLSSLYLNLQGRESMGIVGREEQEALCNELKDKLLTVTDPNSGAKVFENLYIGSVYHGEAMREAPDMSLGYAAYYQNSRQTSRGGVGDPLFEPVKDKWSGEHASTDYQLSSGVFYCNRRIEKEKPHIQDLGVTALSLLGVDAPSEYEGEAIV